MDTETISAFTFRLNDSLVVSVSQDAGGYVISRQNNLKSLYLYVDWVTLHWYVCGADGRSVGRESVRSRDYQNFSDALRLPNFLTYGAPLGARERSAITSASTNQSSWPDYGQILRHQYGISVADSQTFLQVKRP